MFYSYDKVYRSLIYFVMQIVPSGVDVVDGESYGVRLSDPSGHSPSIAVNIEESYDKPIELGSTSAGFNAVFTINAVSRVQRDALKSIVHSGLLSKQIPIYSTFDITSFIPTDFTIEQYLVIADYFKIQNMPNFETDRDKFFWVSIVFATLDMLVFP